MKALKRTLTLLLTAAVMTAAIPFAALATGEPATLAEEATESTEQIGISTAAEFLAMESGKSYYLENDIDFEGNTYVTLVATFNGSLDGRGHALKNFKLENETTTTDGHMGVFGKVCNGDYTTVKNLVIGSAEQPISMTNNAKVDGYHGFLAGQIMTDDYIGQFDNITVYANYTNKGEGKYFAGGLIGYAKNLVMTACTANGTLTDAVGNVSIEKNLGGLVGLVNTNYNRQNVMDGCTNNATITVAGNGNSVRAGGMIAFSGSPLLIENCINTGAITATSYAGGLVGLRNASDLYIKNSKSTGTASGATKTGVLLGSTAGTVTNCYLYITGCGDDLDTAATPVSSLEDLQGMTTAGGVYKLTKDLDLEGNSFTNYVFSSENGFNGVFDGAGYSIYNFTLNGASGSDAGFFNRLSGQKATLITNLNLGTAENPVIVNTAETGGKLVGILSPFVSGSRNASGTAVYTTTTATLINGVNIYANVSHTGGKAGVGGFIGASSACYFANNTFSGNVNVNMSNLGNTWFNLSAFVSDPESDRTLFYQCVNYADMAVASANGKEIRVAGMVAYSTKRNLYIKSANYGDINVEVTTPATGAEISVGGLQGRLSGTSRVVAFDCTNFGNLSSPKYASGFFAWAKNPLTLTGNVNLGTISGADATNDAFYNYSGDLKINDVTQTELPVTKTACTTAASDLNFTMKTGASVRLETPAGLRFQATVNTNGLYWERMSMYTEVGYGMLISPTVFVTHAEAFTREALDAYAEKQLGYTAEQSAYVEIDNTDKWFTGTEGCIAGTLANIQTNHYSAAFSGLAYLDLTVNGQTVRTLYAGTAQSRSVKEVATSALNDLLYKAADGKLYRADGTEYTEADAADYTNVVESGKTLETVDGTFDLVSPYTEAERTVLAGFAN
ncbi:MAG TPA: hypothetical protein DDW30_00930 [Clostridiales bacterium]|nr:hypothetical protein [Clostridiales bacterium]